MKCYCTKEMVRHDTGDYVCSDPKCRWIWDKDETPPFHMKYPWWIRKTPKILMFCYGVKQKRIPKDMYEKFVILAEEHLRPKPNPHCSACGKEMGPFIQRTAHGREEFCSWGCSFDQEHSLARAEAHKDEVI